QNRPASAGSSTALSHHIRSTAIVVVFMALLLCCCTHSHFELRVCDMRDAGAAPVAAVFPPAGETAAPVAADAHRLAEQAAGHRIQTGVALPAALRPRPPRAPPGEKARR